MAPKRLGPDFGYLVASSWVTNLADGLALAAGPLLIRSQTNSPGLVAVAVTVQLLPWMLFGLQVGVLADRVDRRQLLIWSNLARTIVLVVLAALAATGAINAYLVLAFLFVLATIEVFADTTTRTLLPMLVADDDLGIGNARLMFGTITLNQLVGPPLGAFLFAAAMAVPFSVEAALVVLGVVIVARLSHAAGQVTPRPPTTVRTEIADGLRWMRDHPAVRTLTLTVVAFNVTYGAVWSIRVLYATDVLHMSAVGFGLLMTSSAVGGVVGTMIYGRLERSIGAANIMRIGLSIEVLSHLVLATTRLIPLAYAVFFVFGIHEATWGTTATTIRQRVVPLDLQGRVGSAYGLGVYGGLLIGTAIGGAIAERWGIIATYWFAFGGSALILAALWPRLHPLASARRA